MKVLVLFESFFGNTEKIARAIAAPLSSQAEIEVVQVASLAPEQLDASDVLIVGSPTRGFNAGEETKKWMKSLSRGSLKGKNVAAFDTRMDVKQVNNAILTFFAGIFGYAAKPIGAALVRAGGVQLAEPEGFIVNGSEGPLRDGELERAAEWTKTLFSKI